MTQSQPAHVTISAPTRLGRPRAGSLKVISLLLSLSVSLISCADSADEEMDLLMSTDKISTSRLRDNLRVLSERAALRVAVGSASILPPDPISGGKRRHPDEKASTTPSQTAHDDP